MVKLEQEWVCTDGLLLVVVGLVVPFLVPPAHDSVSAQLVGLGY